MKRYKLCSDCVHFSYDEYQIGEDWDEVLICDKEHYDHIGWNTDPCEDFEEEKC